MILAEIVEGKKEALRVEEGARILDVSIKKIYRMAAKGQIPCLKISHSIRFDPHDIAVWLRGQSRAEPASSVPLQSSRYLARIGGDRQFSRVSRVFDRTLDPPNSVRSGA